MSVHKSLKSKTALKRHRNVLKRSERTEKLREKGKWKEGDSVFGLPKTKTFKPKRRSKAKKKETLTASTEATPVEEKEISP